MKHEIKACRWPVDGATCNFKAQLICRWLVVMTAWPDTGGKGLTRTNFFLPTSIVLEVILL